MPVKEVFAERIVFCVKDWFVPVLPVLPKVGVGIWATILGVSWGDARGEVGCVWNVGI